MTMFTPHASAKWRSRDEKSHFYLKPNFNMTGFGVTFILSASCGPSGTAVAETAKDTMVTVVTFKSQT